MHGFDEFFGNLYHLNAEEEPELPNWPPTGRLPQLPGAVWARGVLHRWATRGAFRVHIDGFNLLPYLTGEAERSPRQLFVYFSSDDGDVLALRFDNWKAVFMEQRAQGTLQLWAEPLVALRFPKLFNLRTDPFERADVTSNTYRDWFLNNDYIALAATALMTQFLATFREFPPRQKAASFTVEQAVAKLEAALTTGH